MRLLVIKSEISNYWLATSILMLVKLLLHLLTNTNYELHRDEMLYFNMADHLSFGYATVPPVTGFLAFIVKSISGHSVFGIRLIPALLGTASIFIISKIVRDSGGGIPALIIASVSFILSPGFLLFDTLFTPNVVEQFLWLLTTYLLFRMTKLNSPVLWIWIGILMGLSFLTKYSVSFYILGFFIAMLLTGCGKLFKTRYFYYSIIIGIIIITPNLIWQFTHGWPVMNHMQELKRTQLDNMEYINYLTDVVSLNSAAVLIWVAGFFSLLFLRAEKKSRFIGVASLLIFLFFFFSKGKGYYILGLFPFLFAVGGCTMERYLKGRMNLVRYFVLLIIILYSMISIPFGLQVMSFDQLCKYTEKTKHLLIYPFYRWEDGKIHNISQVYSDMTGWRDLTFSVAKTYHQLSEEEQEKCTIFVERNYGVAGAIHFYGKEYRLPEPVTFLESYVMWAPDNIPDGPIIYIHKSPGGFNNLFDKITVTGSVNDNHFREYGLKIFLCTGPKTNIQEVYKQKAIEEKYLYRP